MAEQPITPPSAAAVPAEAAAGYREVRYEISREFLPILSGLRTSLLVSTYQAGKLAVVGCQAGQLALSFLNFEQCMGVAVRPERIAVGSRHQIWFLQNASDLPPQSATPLSRDGCYLTRAAHITGNIHVHELGWSGEELWIVNTLFSCLCTLHDEFSFVPRWRPPFISALEPQDRCHLNGMAMEGGRPKYLTALGESNEPSGWRPQKAEGGVLIDVADGHVVARGLSMPHSPRLYGGRLWVLNSGRGELGFIEPQSGRYECVERVPGYTRGLAFSGPYAFVGLSRIRETAVFGGVPIAAQRDQLRCAVAVIDLRSGRSVAFLQFRTGVEEIFDVQVLPGMVHPMLNGPAPVQDDAHEVWLIPSADRAATLAHGGTAQAAIVPAARAPAGTDRPPAAAEADAVQPYNLGNRFLAEDRFEEAAAQYEQAVRRSPGFAPGHLNLGAAYQSLRRLDKAREHYSRALQLEPDSADAHVRMSALCLLEGDFERGWQEYEWRWQSEGFQAPPPDMERLAPRWDGRALTQQTLLVYGEQGIGDDLMFVSCLPEVLARVQHLVLVCRPRLVPLFQRSFPQAAVHSTSLLFEPQRWPELGPVDFQLAVGSLPRFLRRRAEDFPARRQYLAADPQRVGVWRQRLAALGPGVSVGISWRGGHGVTEIRRRSTDLRQWLPALSVSGVHAVNLQYGKTEAELAAARSQWGLQIQHWPELDPLEDMDEFAALVAALDLVISIDNSTVHLAGALGVPVWTLLPTVSETCWRWQLDREDVLWYPGMKLFRQGRLGDWEPVFERVRRELEQRVHSASGTTDSTTANPPDTGREEVRDVSAQPPSGEPGHPLHERISLLQRGLSGTPRDAEVYNELGFLLGETGRHAAALASYGAAIQADPSFAPAYANLAYGLADQGETDAARRHYESAYQRQPSPRLRIVKEVVLPAIYESLDQLQQSRRQLADNLQRLHAENVRVDPRCEVLPTLFYLAYQGLNDRPIQTDFARLASVPGGPNLTPEPPRGRRIRLGILSRYLKDHTIGRLNHGLIEQLPRDEFEVIVLSVGAADDSLGRRIRCAADGFVPVPTALAQALAAVAAQQLDAIFYPDLGMDPLTSTLAMTRFAPVQCVTWGHPVTTGLPAIDYFISSADLDSETSQDHYSEKLVRLSRLAVCYERPSITAPARDRASWRLPERGPLYLCPQSLFKLHPEFDDLLGGILRADPQGWLVLVEGKHARWRELLERRWAQTLADVRSRIRFLPHQPRGDFLALLTLADVLLDPIHFGGGNTSYEALGLGVPIVTLPSQFLRGRLTYALYRQMDLPDLIAETPAAYVELAVRLGTNPDVRRQMSARIRERSELLFQDRQGVQELASFLLRACRASCPAV